ncbi:MAG TPA: IclR family transcriptional regulator [Sphingomonas sp.]|nr:IclR family transcriptional regulator [Sphingomonas sp.]
MTRISEPAGGSAAKHKNVYAAPALDKAFDVIELLAAEPDGLTLTEIAGRLERSLSELFRIAVVMERRGYLVKDPATDRLVVAYKLLDLAWRATPARHLTAAAIPVMTALARDAEQSCHLVVRNRNQGLVVVREQSPAVSGFCVSTGAPIDLVRSCSGQVILAFSAPARTDAVIEELALGAAEARRLRDRLETVRAQGYGLQPSTIAPGVTDISYPVRGFDGDLVAALTIPFLELIDGSQRIGLDAARERLAVAADALSTRLGWTGHGADVDDGGVIEPRRRPRRANG